MQPEVILFAQGIIAVLVGFIVEGLKQAGLPSKYAMLASAGLGLLMGLLASYLTDEVSLATGVFGGLLAGAVASGFYEGGKAVMKPRSKSSQL